MNKKDNLPLPFGGSSLLVIFAVLCLTVLALLSYRTVIAQRRMTDSTLDSVNAYYNADREAQSIYARIRLGELPEGVEEEDGVYRFYCTISETQTLYVEVTQLDGTWTILRWQAEAAPGKMKESLPVWEGE